MENTFQMKKKMQKTLENTRFSGCPIIAVAAKPGGPEVGYHSDYKIFLIVPFVAMTQNLIVRMWVVINARLSDSLFYIGGKKLQPRGKLS